MLVVDDSGARAIRLDFIEAGDKHRVVSAE